MKTLKNFQKTIGYKFSSTAILREALTHKSYAFEKKTAGQDNQRLEFFGDAILELIASEYLYERYPDATEGRLTKMRSAMTRGEALFQLACHDARLRKPRFQSRRLFSLVRLLSAAAARVSSGSSG